MSQGENYPSGMGSDFHLSDEILAVIPTDPYDQLDLARKITSMAIASRVSKLESETWCLKQKMTEKDRLIQDLQEKVIKLERAFQDADDRLRVVLVENEKLSDEKEALMIATKKLNKDLAKLETFKRQLMQSLNDDNSSQAETVDIGTCEQSVAKSSLSSSLKDENSMGYTSSNKFQSGLADSTNTFQAARNAGNRFSITPYITPRLTPAGTPKVASTLGSPKGLSTAATPKLNSGATSPRKSHVEARSTFSSWYPPSQQSSAPSSPPHGRSLSGRTPRIDGKEFFRQARNRLQYEQFSAFLANIKELNAHKQSRQETLRKAEEIFGPDNRDLYLSFKGLLSRSTS